MRWKRSRAGGHVAQIAVGAYHVYGGYAAYINVPGPRGGKKRLNLGNHRTMEKAKRACERHFEAGCDVSHADRSEKQRRVRAS